MFIEILLKMLLFKGGVLIYAEHCIANVVYSFAQMCKENKEIYIYNSQCIFFLFLIKIDDPHLIIYIILY